MLLIAVSDIRDEPYDSIDYSQSVRLFTAKAGPWASWRVEVAEMLELHADDLRRLGRAEIAAREAREPPPVRAQPAVGPIVIPHQTIGPTPPAPVVSLRRPKPLKPRLRQDNAAPGAWVRQFARRRA